MDKYHKKARNKMIATVVLGVFLNLLFYIFKIVGFNMLIVFFFGNLIFFIAYLIPSVKSCICIFRIVRFVKKDALTAEIGQAEFCNGKDAIFFTKAVIFIKYLRIKKIDYSKIYSLKPHQKRHNYSGDTEIWDFIGSLEITLISRESYEIFVSNYSEDNAYLKMFMKTKRIRLDDNIDKDLMSICELIKRNNNSIFIEEKQVHSIWENILLK